MVLHPYVGFCFSVVFWLVSLGCSIYLSDYAWYFLLLGYSIIVLILFIFVGLVFILFIVLLLWVLDEIYSVAFFWYASFLLIALLLCVGLLGCMEGGGYAAASVLLLLVVSAWIVAGVQVVFLQSWVHERLGLVFLVLPSSPGLSMGWVFFIGYAFLVWFTCWEH